MALWEDRGKARREELEDLVPGSGVRVQLDRGAWAALSQGKPGTWSWGRAALTILLSFAAGLVIYLTVYTELPWLVGLALAYAYLLWRARTVHAEYLRRQGDVGSSAP